MDGPGFARTLTFRLTGRLRSCIRPLDAACLIRPLALMGSESSTPFHRIALKVRGEDRDWSSPVSDRPRSRRCPSQVQALWTLFPRGRSVRLRDLRREGGAVSHDRPGDTGEFVRYGDSNDIRMAPPRLAEQGFEKRRSARVWRGLRRGPGLLAEPGSRARR
jgi:hypothetical protein